MSVEALENLPVEVLENLSINIDNTIAEGRQFYDLVNFGACDFSSTSPTGVQFRDCNFTDCDFNTLWLDENQFTNCTFTRCGFNQSIWAAVKFQKCWFVQCAFENDYDMDDVLFYDCTFMSTEFTDKPINTQGDDKIRFNVCTFYRGCFDRYCLNSISFTNSTIKEMEFSSSPMRNALIKCVDMVKCVFKSIYVSNSKWDSVRFKKCSWDGVTLYQFNDFDRVVLMETKVKNCKGDERSLKNILVSPYCVDMDSDFSGISSMLDCRRGSSTPAPAIAPAPSLKKSKAPCLYTSEGL